MDDLIRHLGLTNQTLLVQGDVSEYAFVGEMFEQIEKEFGRIDVLYNNAALSGPVVFRWRTRKAIFRRVQGGSQRPPHRVWRMASLEQQEEFMEGQLGDRRNGGNLLHESIHHHVLHAYPVVSRTPPRSPPNSPSGITLRGRSRGKGSPCSPSTVGGLHGADPAGKRRVFDKGSKARAPASGATFPEALERDTLERTVGRRVIGSPGLRRARARSQSKARSGGRSVEAASRWAASPMSSRPGPFPLPPRSRGTRPGRQGRYSPSGKPFQGDVPIEFIRPAAFRGPGPP